MLINLADLEKQKDDDELLQLPKKDDIMQDFYDIFRTTPAEATDKQKKLFLFAMRHILPAIDTRWKKKEELRGLQTFEDIDTCTEAFIAVLAKYWTIPEWPMEGRPAPVPAPLQQQQDNIPNEDEVPQPQKKKRKRGDKEAISRDITGVEKQKCISDYVQQSIRIRDARKEPGSKAKYREWDQFLQFLVTPGMPPPTGFGENECMQQYQSIVDNFGENKDDSSATNTGENTPSTNSTTSSSQGAYSTMSDLWLTQDFNA